MGDTYSMRGPANLNVASPQPADSREPGAPPDRQGRGAVVLLDGKWELLEVVGSGGMGSVFRAHDVVLDRVVAIKLLSTKLLADDEFISRFEREARMMAKLEHPNLMPIYVVGRHQAVPFIVMKFLEGSTLDEHMRARAGFLSLDEVASIARQLCSTLDFIHRRGVVHRDIKPGNIFVSPEGHVTLLDLGLMRSQKQEGEGPRLTQQGLTVGTPGYMAPEQATGARDLDHRADLYALGVVLFELLTGSAPFCADSDFELLIAHRDQPIPNASALQPGVPPAMSAVLARALAKRKEDRFESAAELLQAFELARCGPAALASAPEATSRVSSTRSPAPESRSLLAAKVDPDQAVPAPRWGRARRPGIAAGLAVAMVVGVGWGLNRPTDSAAEVRPPPVAAVLPPAPIVVELWAHPAEPAQAVPEVRPPLPVRTRKPAIEGSTTRCEPTAPWRASARTRLQEIQQLAAATETGAAWAQFDEIEGPLSILIGDATTQAQCKDVDRQLRQWAAKFAPASAGPLKVAN